MKRKLSKRSVTAALILVILAIVLFFCLRAGDVGERRADAETAAADSSMAADDPGSEDRKNGDSSAADSQTAAEETLPENGSEAMSVADGQLPQTTPSQEEVQPVVTKRADLPADTRVDNLTVTVNSDPQDRTYTICKQSAKENLSKQFPRYMPGHGCSASSLACVLGAYAGFAEKPYYLVENVEREMFGDAWTKNYSKKDTDDSKSRPMPISLYGMTKVLDAYQVKYRYVRAFEDTQAMAEIEAHLKSGNPVIFIVSAKSRFKGARKNKWTTGYHCMTMLGMTDTDEVIIADTVDRSRDIFGDDQRIKYAPLDELIGYMFSCTDTTSTSLYWGGKASSGGYILINPQEE